jgi:pilus assembly protein CpaF
VSQELQVQVRDPFGSVRHLTFDTPGLLWVGREPECEIAILAQNVSRRHVSVELCPEGLKVTDASSNGTFVNELALRRAVRIVLEAKCVLVVGSHTVTVERGGATAARQRPTAPSVPALRALPGGATPTKLVTPSPSKSLAQTERPSPAPTNESTASVGGVDARRRIHRQLLDQLDLASLDRSKLDPVVMRPKVLSALRRIVSEMAGEVPGREAQETLVQELCDEALGLGPLERLLSDPDVSEIMVVDAHTIFAERRGRIEHTGLRFTDDDSVRAVIERIVTPLGRRIDESSPLVDARLRDGSRVNAVIPPLAIKGPCITIRKFAKDPLTMADLTRFGSMTAQMAAFLERAVKVRKNIVISGGTGSGKTTLLNVLSGSVPSHERIVTVEDAAELQLAQPHVVSLEARPPNLEGKGEYSIRDLVKNALRMRPDRIVVGECRGGEAIDMLQAMNTGHEGSMTTTHANSPREAVARIETLCLMAGLDLPIRAIRQQIASSVHIILQQSRFSDGSRRITSVAEVVGIDDDGEVELREIFLFKVLRAGVGGKIEGEFIATGYLPSFLDQFIAHQLVTDGAYL